MHRILACCGSDTTTHKSRLITLKLSLLFIGVVMIIKLFSSNREFDDSRSLMMPLTYLFPSWYHHSNGVYASEEPLLQGKTVAWSFVYGQIVLSLVPETLELRVLAQVNPARLWMRVNSRMSKFYLHVHQLRIQAQMV